SDFWGSLGSFSENSTSRVQPFPQWLLITRSIKVCATPMLAQLMITGEDCVKPSPPYIAGFSSSVLDFPPKNLEKKPISKSPYLFSNALALRRAGAPA